MERMTIQKANGDFAIAILGLCSEEKHYEKIQIAVNRLAEYEDTGLTPNDIKDLKNEFCLLCGKYKNAHLGACNDCRWKNVDG